MKKNSISVTEVKIEVIKPSEGLVGFASCVINRSVFLGSIGIHRRLDGLGYRITYPTKNIGHNKLYLYHPINSECGKMIEQAVVNKCFEVFEKSDESNGRYSKDYDTDR